MILHYFKSKQNKENIIAKDIYNQLISINKLIVSRGILFNKNYFNLAFEINTLLLFCFFFGCWASRPLPKAFRAQTPSQEALGASLGPT